MNIDIRNERIDGIIFDDRENPIKWGSSYLYMPVISHSEHFLCEWKDLDNLIKALEHARMLANK